MSAEIRQLGEAIRSARMKKGLTQEALSELLDITPVHLKNIESSRRKPSVPLLFMMMELLDFSVDALVFPQRGEADVIHTAGLTEEVFEGYLYSAGIPSPDLLIRPGGEQRLSNFLLWQCAYSEFYYTDVLWPDFSKEELHRAIAAYQRRNRRFGGVKQV